jgi:hypothetical protein
MSEPSLSTDNILPLIQTIRGQRVILAADLARLYSVPTKRLNEAVKRNKSRFPSDFMFQLARLEALAHSRSQFATLNAQGANIKHLAYAFTEHGAIMAANVLNSPRATQMSVFVVRAFVKMRSAFKDSRELTQKLALLEQELKIRLNIHEAAIVDVLQRIMKILDPPPPPPEPPPPEIGFHVREDAVPYRIRRRSAR